MLLGTVNPGIGSRSRAGAGHGGSGGRYSTNGGGSAYGDLYEPFQFGSAGYSAGAGIIWMNITGTVGYKHVTEVTFGTGNCRLTFGCSSSAKISSF